MGFQRFYLIAGAFFCVKLVGEGYAVSFRLGWWGEKSGGVTAGRKFIAGLCNV